MKIRTILRVLITAATQPATYRLAVIAAAAFGFAVDPDLMAEITTISVAVFGIVDLVLQHRRG